MKHDYNLTDTIDFVTTSEKPVELIRSLYNRRDFKLWLELLTSCYGDLSGVELNDSNMTNPYGDTSILSGIKMIEAGLSLIHSDDDVTRRRCVQLIEHGLGAFDDADKKLLLAAFRGNNFSFVTQSVLTQAFPDFFEEEE